MGRSQPLISSHADWGWGYAPFCRDADRPVSLCRSHSFLHSNSAEAVAMGLLKQFEGMQLPAASELDWLVPEHDAPQKVGVWGGALPGQLHRCSEGAVWGCSGRSWACNQGSTLNIGAENPPPPRARESFA